MLLMAHLTPGKLAPFIWVTLLTAFAGATLILKSRAFGVYTPSCRIGMFTNFEPISPSAHVISFEN